jgi:hypothetical protein
MSLLSELISRLSCKFLSNAFKLPFKSNIVGLGGNEFCVGIKNYNCFGIKKRYYLDGSFGTLLISLNSSSKGETFASDELNNPNGPLRNQVKQVGSRPSLSMCPQHPGTIIPSSDPADPADCGRDVVEEGEFVFKGAILAGFLIDCVN